MRKTKRILAMALCLTAAVSLEAFAGVTASAAPAASAPSYIIANPYENVDWQTYGQYKAAYHTHSTNSDGSNTRTAMIEDHYSKGFDILTMGDHDFTTYTWDAPGYGGGPGLSNPGIGLLSSERRAEIEAGMGRNGKGMIGVEYSNEQSATDHIMTFWSDFNNTPRGSLTAAQKMAETINTAGELGGISHLNHPGRYLSPGVSSGSSLENVVTAANNPASIQKYVDLFMDDLTCVGMEIINKIDNESKGDRILWDNILKVTMPQSRPVWGFSNDDSHSLNATGYSWNVMLLPELTLAADRAAMEAGAFYAVSRVDRLENINDTLQDGVTSTPGSGTAASLYLLEQPTPSISSIVVDGSTITITGADYDTIDWISGVERGLSKVVATGNSIDVSEHASIIENTYVRAHLKSSTGVAFTQPFGVMEAPALSLATDANLVKAGDYFTLSPAFVEAVNSNVATLTFTFDAAKFQYRGFTPPTGMTLVDWAVDGNQLKLTIMKQDYNIKDLGAVLFSALENAELNNEELSIGLAVEFVVKAAAGAKSIANAQASVRFTTSTGVQGPYTLIDLSNLVDRFGVKAGDPDWAQARFYDFNGNGEIDIYDISYLAQLIV